MPLLTIKEAMKELGVKSRQSIVNMSRKGRLTIVYVPISGEKRSAPRVESAEIDQIIKRHRGADSKQPDPPMPPAHRPPPPAKPTRRRRATLSHFE